MKNINKIEGVCPLTDKDMAQTEGGVIYAFLLAAAETYLVVCGLATAAGAATAYIQNKFSK